nr:PREDICTED: putative BMP-2-inducible kinase-like protein [Latimeria chalumnae]|eukprot:XP_014350546.1 PREDICTED: putative BMP-2-inducible kinase-like protein [Latimeria chalumnae]
MDVKSNEKLTQPTKETKTGKRNAGDCLGQQGHKGGEESDSDFESDPPSPKSSEEEEQEDEEALNSEHGEFNDDNDTEPENLGHRPLLMDSEEEGDEEEKNSSDSDNDHRKGKHSSEGPYRPNVASPNSKEPGTALITPPDSPAIIGSTVSQANTDIFGAVPFLGSTQQAQPGNAAKNTDIFAKAPFKVVAVTPETQDQDEFDVFSKAPFGRKLSQSGQQGGGPLTQTPPVSPSSVDVFGCTPFQPTPTLEGTKGESKEDLFGHVPFDEITTNQQQKVKQQRSLQKLSSRQRRTKQEASSGNGKRHHGTPTSTRKTSKPNFRTPERVRRHKKVGRRDSQSSNELLTISDSKENISISLPEGKDKGTPLQADEEMLDPFGAKPFYAQELARHHQLQGLSDNRADQNTVANQPRQTSLHGTFPSAEDLKMDDFGAVPFTELVLHTVTPPQQQVELDPFGAAPFPTKQ